MSRPTRIAAAFAALFLLAQMPQSLAGGNLEACDGKPTRTSDPASSESCQRVLDDPTATPRDRARALTRLAYLSQYRGKIREANGLFEKAVEADPTFVEPRLALGRWQILGNRAGDALETLKGVLALDPDNAEAHVGIGRAHSFLQQWQAALDAFDKAKKLDPFGSDPYFYRGFALEQMGRFIEAAGEYSEAAARYKEDQGQDIMTTGDPLEHAARALTRGNRLELAIGVLTTLIERRTPQDPSADLLQRRADVYERTGNVAAALEDLGAAARASQPQERPAFYLKQGMLMQRLGRVDDARKTIGEAMQGADLRTRLRTQVFLRNNGHADVQINGEYDSTTRDALQACLSTADCGAAFSRSI